MSLNFVISGAGFSKKLINFNNKENGYSTTDSYVINNEEAINYIKKYYNCDDGKFNLWKDIKHNLYEHYTKYRKDNIAVLYFNGIIEPIVMDESIK